MMTPPLDAWQPLSVSQVATVPGYVPARWWLSGGWAVDRWLGAQTREHGDIDVSVVRPDWQALIDALPGRLTAYAAMSGRILPLAEHTDDPDLHNLWVTDGDAWVLQVNIEEGDESGWRYRRDERVRRDWRDVVHVLEGVPTGSLATQLLWKSAHPLPEDDHDLAVSLPLLTPAERHWLAGAVALAHPESPWLAAGPLAAEWTGRRLPTPIRGAHPSWRAARPDDE